MKKRNNKYTFSCSNCGNEFSHNQPNARLCSTACRNEFYIVKYKRHGKNIPSGTVGAMAEMLASADLMEKGYSVFRSLSPSSYCDVIAVNPKYKKIIEVEVRTGYLSYNNKLYFNMLLSKNNNGNVSVFAIVERHTGKVRYFDMEKNEIDLNML